MFQFRAFPSYDYFIHRTILEYCSSVLPHSDISGSLLICSSPKLFAACRVLHRLLMPRHSPCALFSLTFVKENYTPFCPPCGELHSVPFPFPLRFETRFKTGWGRGRAAMRFFDPYRIISISWFSELCRFNRSCLQNCIYPFLKKIKVPQFALIKSVIISMITPSVALLSIIFLCSVFKVQFAACAVGGE